LEKNCLKDKGTDSRQFICRSLLSNSGCHTKVKARAGLPYENDGDACWKIRIKALKETNLGMIRASVILNALKIDVVWFFHIDISLRTP